MKSVKIIAQLASLWLLMWSLVICHLLFDVSLETVQFFNWTVNRDVVFYLSFALIPVAWLIQFLLSYTALRRKRKHRSAITVSHVASILVLIGALVLLYFSLTTSSTDLWGQSRLFWFDLGILVLVASWSIEFSIALYFMMLK